MKASKRLLTLIRHKKIETPYLNLATEEFCLREVKNEGDLLLFYINSPSVIIGSHQNPWQESNTDYLEAKNIELVRRISGGGAVYHDSGNLNFSIITPFKPNKMGDFEGATKPVIDCLQRLGADAVFNGKNGITIHGKKISGHAQFTDRKKIITHGTLLFNTDLHRLSKALNTTLSSSIQSKSVPSNRSEVTNISDFIAPTICISTLKRELISEVIRRYDNFRQIGLSDQDYNKIQALSQNKYRSWGHKYGKTPVFKIMNHLQISGDVLTIQLFINKGIIQSVELAEGISESRVISKRLDRLVGVRFHPDLITDRGIVNHKH